MNNFFGGSCGWIIIILLLLCCCGGCGNGLSTASDLRSDGRRQALAKRPPAFFGRPFFVCQGKGLRLGPL